MMFDRLEAELGDEEVVGTRDLGSATRACRTPLGASLSPRHVLAADRSFSGGWRRASRDGSTPPSQMTWSRLSPSPSLWWTSYYRHLRLISSGDSSPVTPPLMPALCPSRRWHPWSRHHRMQISSLIYRRRRPNSGENR